jgi:S-adenosylmethionine-diacylglycerol 3-amino-3-carboxypropyl transferase
MKTVSGLQYSCCNEDTRSELEALDVKGRRVLSIAAAGERAFALLLGDPHEVVAIDRNPAQINLGQLKVAAMRQLERDAYLGFLGIAPDESRAATYRRLRADLPDAARSYWDARPRDIADGIHAVGRTERGIARMSWVLRRVLGGGIARVRACSTLEEQHDVAQSLVDRRSVRTALACIFNPLTGRLLLRDPVYYGEGRRDAASYLRERVKTTLAHHRYDDCFILSLFVDGHLKHSPSLPLDLGEDTYPTVRERLDRLTFETSCITQYLARQPAGAFDAFSLSDLGGYLTIREFGELLALVERTGSAHATVCIREYISTPTRAVAWPPSLVRRNDLERQLDRTDRSVGCTFACAVKEPGRPASAVA